MRYAVRHATTLEYAMPVAQARFNLRLRPAPWSGQTLASHQLRFAPQPDSRENFAGPYCVNTTLIGFQSSIDRLEVESRFAIEVSDRQGPDFGPAIGEVQAEALATRDVSPLSPAPYMFGSRIAGADSEIGDWAAASIDRGMDILTAADAMTAAIHREFTYTPGATDSMTRPHEAFRLRKGVCQDFAHVMITALRAHGIAAAYASGYLRTDPPPGMPRLIGADAMHAWVNVWCGSDIGWIGFDPTNDCRVRADHIQIAMGRDYADVAPIDGTFVGAAPQTMTTSVDVQPESEDA